MFRFVKTTVCFMFIASMAHGATFSSAALTNPPPNSTLSSTNITFEWSDAGSPRYLLYLGSSVGGSEYYNSGPLLTNWVAATDVPTNNIVYVRLWTKVDDIMTNSSYWVRDYVFNVDADNDGILDTIDPNPGSYDGRTTVNSTNFSITILGSGRVANMQVDQTMFDAMAVGDANTNMATLSQMVLAYFDDVFDMIFFTCDQDSSPAPYAGKHWGIQNDVQGIGKSIYDNSANYGSDGELESVIHFPKKGAVAGGPSLHEMLHRWANDLSSVPTGSHWGYAGIPGQLGGWDPATFSDLGGGQYQANNGRSGSTYFGLVANGGNGLPFADFELYLMGMIPTNGIPDILYANNPAWVDQGNGIFSADSISTVTMGDVVSTDGVRVPDYNSSQKNFRIIHLILSVDPLENIRWIDYDEEVYNFSLAGDDGSSLYNFWEATGGRGTVAMDDLVSTLRRPVISSMETLAVSNGTAQFEFTGRDRVLYSLERTTNFTDWSAVLASVYTTGGVVTVSDPDATNYPSAFYRLRLQ